MTTKEYREVKCASYSLLSKLSTHPRLVRAMLDGQQIKSKFMDLGTLIDILLTAPSEFDDTFYVMQSKIPTESYLGLVKEFIRLRDLFEEEIGNKDLFDTDLTILQARTNIGFQSAWKSETIITNFHRECDSYLSDYANAGDRMIISSYDLANAKRMCDQVMANPDTAKYFTPKEGVEIWYQEPIFFTIESKAVKILPDIVYIDHINKTITVIDVKTFSESFRKSYLKYKYYYQAALYLMGIYEIIQNTSLEDYAIDSFQYLAIDTSGFELPTLHKISRQHIHAATYGGDIATFHVKGIVDLLNDYQWHMENDKWDFSREVYENGFKMIEG